MNPLNFHDENPSGEEDGDDVMELDDEYDNSDNEHGNVDEVDEDPSDDEDEAQPPERMQLMMPSSVHRDDVVGLGLEDLIAQELELQKGQVNDALEKLHVALAHTSLLWQTKVQTANTTKK